MPSEPARRTPSRDQRFHRAARGQKWSSPGTAHSSRRHHATRAPGRANGANRETHFARLAGGRRGARSEYPARRDFELHPDARETDSRRRSAPKNNRADRKADLPRQRNRQQSAQFLANRRSGVRRSESELCPGRNPHAGTTSVQNGAGERHQELYRAVATRSWLHHASPTSISEPVHERS